MDKNIILAIVAVVAIFGGFLAVDWVGEYNLLIPAASAGTQEAPATTPAKTTDDLQREIDRLEQEKQAAAQRQAELEAQKAEAAKKEASPVDERIEALEERITNLEKQAVAACALLDAMRQELEALKAPQAPMETPAQ